MVAQTLSLVGDQLLAIALPLWVFDQTGSAAATAGAGLCRVLPLALLGAVGGAVVDRSRRRRLLVVTTALRGAAAAPLLLVGWTAVPLAMVFGVVAVLACIGQVSGPAVGASLPAVVSPADLPRANAQLAARTVLVQLSAPALGALLYQSHGLVPVVAVNIGLYGLATLVWLALPLRVPTPSSRNRLLGDAIDGFGVVRRDAVLSRLLAAASLAFIGLSLALALLIPFVRSELRAPARAVGLLTTTEAVGALFGSCVLPALRRQRGESFLLRIGMLGLPAATVGLVISRNVVQALPGLFCAGLLLTFLTTGLQIHVQANIKGTHLGRVLGIVMTAVGLATVVGSGLALALPGVLSLRACLLVAAAIEVAGVALYLLAPSAGGGASGPVPR
jgi:MFS family permease